MKFTLIPAATLAQEFEDVAKAQRAHSLRESGHFVEEVWQEVRDNYSGSEATALAHFSGLLRGRFYAAAQDAGGGL